MGRTFNSGQGCVNIKRVIVVGKDRGAKMLAALDVEPTRDELTLVNNKAVVTIEGVRDKLKVLLVSGEPNAGERTWRNLLKADANVDLVHFTILRPPEKQDGTPINELSLIAFPTRELFQVKIKEFDLIIFDRYANQSILPLVYFDNIVRYVREGGALLIAAGPEYAGAQSLARTPLGQILPAIPDGSVIEHQDGRTLNPGHAIECAWFILHEARLRNRPDWVDLGVRILDWMWERGWDDGPGGLRYSAGSSRPGACHRCAPMHRAWARE